MIKMKKCAIGLVMSALMMSMAGCSASSDTKTTTAKQTTEEKTSEAETTSEAQTEKETTSEAETTTEAQTEIYNEKESESKCLALADAIWKVYADFGQENKLDAVIGDDELYLSPVGSLDMSKVESFACYQNSISSVNPDALTVMKVDSDYVDEAVKACNDCFNQCMDYQELYPFAEAEVSGCRIYVSGDYVIFLIAGPTAEGDETDEEIEKAVDAMYEKMDEAIKSVFPYISENKAVRVESEDTDDDEEFDGEEGLLQ